MKAPGTKADAQFTQPVRIILTMLVFVVVVAIGAMLAYERLLPIFMANVYLNGFIGLVFIFGILACFWQVFTLISCVSWIEGFAIDRPGHQFTQAPGLLASLAAYLRKRGARSALTTSSTASILDSVATRLDEGREITRYVINLLIFLGLLGTFYGLAVTVPAVVDTIRSLAPQEDGSSMNVFDNLMSGLERQLSGMGTAFGSSLLGLAGSLVIGLLDLLSGRGQNRFYGEMEEWLSSITRIGVLGGGEEADLGGVSNFALADLLEHTTFQMETLQGLIRDTTAGWEKTDKCLVHLADVVERFAESVATTQSANVQLTEQVAYGSDRIVESLRDLSARMRQNDEVWDAEAKMRLRNIDTQLLRIIEEMISARQDVVGGLRSDILSLTSTLREAIQAEQES
ncbi:MAG: biopolymer transporter ExbB [Rhodobacteraceae bacterium]|nr:biopolymer transporter ExbB [Paracoccaceae bacterium]